MESLEVSCVLALEESGADPSLGILVPTPMRFD